MKPLVSDQTPPILARENTPPPTNVRRVRERWYPGIKIGELKVIQADRRRIIFTGSRQFGRVWRTDLGNRVVIGDHHTRTVVVVVKNGAVIVRRYRAVFATQLCRCTSKEK